MASRLYSYTIRKVLRITGFVLLSFAVAGAAGLLFVRAFSIRQVEVDGDGMTIELDRSKLGENLWLIPTDRLTRELVADYPLLSTVRFEKRFPGTLIIHLVKRKPIANIVSGGVSYAVDADGYILGNATSLTAYPVLQFDIGLYAIGSKAADDRVHACLAFLKELNGALAIQRMTNGSGTSIRAIMGNTDILLPQHGDIRRKADTLQTIVEGFRIKGTLPAVIDLRFEKPIVTN